MDPIVPVKDGNKVLCWKGSGGGKGEREGGKTEEVGTAVRNPTPPSSHNPNTMTVIAFSEWQVDTRVYREKCQRGWLSVSAGRGYHHEQRKCMCSWLQEFPFARGHTRLLEVFDAVKI